MHSLATLLMYVQIKGFEVSWPLIPCTLHALKDSNNFIYVHIIQYSINKLKETNLPFLHVVSNESTSQVASIVMGKQKIEVKFIWYPMCMCK